MVGATARYLRKEVSIKFFWRSSSYDTYMSHFFVFLVRVFSFLACLADDCLNVAAMRYSSENKRTPFNQEVLISALHVELDDGINEVGACVGIGVGAVFAEGTDEMA